MKYIKEYYATQAPSHFNCNDWVISAFSTPKVDSNRAYQIAGEYSPEYNRTVNKYNEWSYSLINPDHDLDTTLFRESQLRRATWQ
jgi:hypothetical protein